jgi:hypothetical protein
VTLRRRLISSSPIARVERALLKSVRLSVLIPVANGFGTKRREAMTVRLTLQRLFRSAKEDARFQALVDEGTISGDDLDQLTYADSVEEAWAVIVKGIEGPGGRRRNPGRARQRLKYCSLPENWMVL